MKTSFILYNIFVVPIIYVLAYIGAVFHRKIRQTVRGRRGLFEHLRSQLAQQKSNTTILIHAASMGEYEQARPLLRQLRTHLPGATLVLSLFSPSAYENLRGKSEADITSYLPFDTPRGMWRFVKMLQPAALIIMRHDIWPNLVWMARRQGTINVLADASVHEGSLRHKFGIRRFNRALFGCFDVICPISAAANAAMGKFYNGRQLVKICGDTRFDQVVHRATEKPIASLLPKRLLARENRFIAGSTWPEDDDVVIPAFANFRSSEADALLILVPHEPTSAHLELAEQKCQQQNLTVQRLSALNETTVFDVLLVDRIGILANLYAAGEVAFVGGSFGPGVHSVIEAAAHGVPVLFGPRMRNSAEAIAMEEKKCGFVVASAQAVESRLRMWFADRAALTEVAEAARNFVAARTGADACIAALIQERIKN